MKIGRRIYFDIKTGNVLVDSGEREGFVTKTTVEQDLEVYTILNERVRTSFDYIELEFGQYAQDFAECNDYRVNVDTKLLEFSYPDPNEPNIEPTYQIPLSEQIANNNAYSVELDFRLTMVELGFY